MNHLSLMGFLLLLATVRNTIVTFYVDHEVEQPLDYVQISAIIKTNGQSLEATISKAASIIANVQTTVDAYCHTYAKDKVECEHNVETSAYSINPKYEIVKHRPIFSGFVVTHEMLIKVKESPEFGRLVDDVLKNGVTKINSLEWKPIEEVDSEGRAVTEGMAQANQICEKIGMKLDKILSIQQVTDFGQEEDGEGEEGGDGEDEEEQQEEEQKPLDINDDIVYYRFKVECHPKHK